MQHFEVKINFVKIGLLNIVLFDTTKITSCPTGSWEYKGSCSIVVAI